MKLTLKELTDDIYFAIKGWDYNIYTKSFAKELAKYILEHNQKKFLGEKE